MIVHWPDDSDSSAQLLRTKSDAGVLRRGQRRSPSDQRKIRRHRFSINGHFYNHKVIQPWDTVWKKMQTICSIEMERLRRTDSHYMYVSINAQMYTHWVLSKLEAEFMLQCSPCFTDSSVHACLWLSDECSDQQLHDDASSAASAPQQV